jgi:hypothetical protein
MAGDQASHRENWWRNLSVGLRMPTVDVGANRRAPIFFSKCASGFGVSRLERRHQGNERVCYPTIKLKAVHLPAVRLPAVHLPAVTVGDQHIPTQTIPAQTIPAQTIPAQTIPGGCYDAPKSFAIGNTTVRTSNYAAVDPGYSGTLSTKYWDSTPDVSVPDPTAAGFGELNDAGFPKNQYVRPYVRRDGTFVHGYWRNSPSDGLPTCRVISC